MIEFHFPTLNDKEWVDEVLSASAHQGCIYVFAQLALWAEKYRTRICRVGDALCAQAGVDGQFYMYPAGRYDIREIVAVLSEDAARRGIPLRFSAAEEWQVKELTEAFPGRFEAHESRDDFDYIYRAQDLANLPGRKYHSKRNHIAAFVRRHPDWSYEDISESNAAECIKMADEWMLEAAPSDDLKLENTIIRRALENMSAYGLEGGLIRIDRKVVAFAVGEPLSRTAYDVHFEKALRDYAGGYALINREFSARIAERFEYINREEDLGIEGLRKAKLSYRPALLLKKYLVTEVR